MASSTYDYNRRVIKVPIYNEASACIGWDPAVAPDHTTYSTISVCTDDPRIDAEALWTATKELQRNYDRLRREQERYRGMQSQPIMYVDEARPMTREMFERYEYALRPQMRPATKSHSCVAPDCKETQVEFYKGKLDYLQQRKPDIYQEEYGKCPKLMCLIARIERQ